MGDTANSTEKAQKKGGFFKGVKSEFKKIIWPDKDTIAKQSIAVTLVSIALGIIISVIDFAIKFGIDKILQIG